MWCCSHAMVQSARLGAFEARLEALAASVSDHTAAMQQTGAAHVDKKVVSTYQHCAKPRQTTPHHKQSIYHHQLSRLLLPQGSRQQPVLGCPLPKNRLIIWKGNIKDYLLKTADIFPANIKPMIITNKVYF